MFTTMEKINNDENPFEGLKISDKWKLLHTLDNRSHCPKCRKSRKYFCYTCFVPVVEIRDSVPNIRLPIQVNIIKHCREIDGKSTAAHAAVIAPDDVTIYTYPRIPDYSLDDKVILIFPSKDAISVQDLVSQMRIKQETGGSEVMFTKAVFIDSTWNQCKGIYKDPRIKSLPCAVLKSRISQFWRHQKGSPRWHLATIEAIHQFFVELKIALNQPASNNQPEAPYQQSANLVNNLKAGKLEDTTATVGNENNANTLVSYNGEYDNLLFFFRFMYDKIHCLYKHDDLRSYKRPLE